jgi:hypothetical protein
MPGFQVDGINWSAKLGDTEAKANADFIYNYTWEINTLFEVDTPNTALVYAKDVSLPTITFEKEQYIGSSLQYKFASAAIYDDIRITFYDTKGLTVYLRKWRATVYSNFTGLRPADEYKKMSEIKCYYPKGGKLAQTHTLYGSWPSVIKYGDLTYTSSDVKFVDVTVTYDWAVSTEADDKE